MSHKYKSTYIPTAISHNRSIYRPIAALTFNEFLVALRDYLFAQNHLKIASKLVFALLKKREVLESDRKIVASCLCRVFMFTKKEEWAENGTLRYYNCTCFIQIYQK